MMRHIAICGLLGCGLFTTLAINAERLPNLACDSLAKAITYTLPYWRDMPGSFAPRIINFTTARCPDAQSAMIRQLQTLRAQYQIPLPNDRRSQHH